MFDANLEVSVAKKEAVEKFLEEQQKLEAKKMSLIKDILEQKKSAIKDFEEKKNAAIKDFDEQLAELGYHARVAKSASGRVCGLCQESGHNARTCPNKKAK